MGAAGPRKDLGLAPLRLQELTRRPGLSALGIALEVPQRSWTSDQTRGPTASPHIWNHFFFFEGGRKLRRGTDRSPAQSLFSLTYCGVGAAPPRASGTRCPFSAARVRGAAPASQAQLDLPRGSRTHPGLRGASPG